MTNEPEHHVAEIIAAAGGRLVSRIRLQKIAYLLDQLGSESGFDYVYYHYGPYSRDLDNAVLDAEAFGLVQEKFDYRQTDGARYSIFENKQAVDGFTTLKDGRLRDLAKRLASKNVTVLELAATARWLVVDEGIPDWETEIRRRKGSKTDKGRLEEAKKLLSEIGLDLPQQAA
ncbi:hypothetical protein CN176_03460 [Sinorhizobium medicae]|uniref:hypothetical protein n=1 Tax=Sinorhizobium medicae TaxID=110321 RepID=UPI000FDB2BA0|nr:hypothetical protein [Sinorhizobium medicae]RVJ45855.1 hypothetical protein CN176_03460 [Sinorhizobium medicae]